MADKFKQSQSLVIEIKFLDGDTRTITLRNPKSTITTSEIAEIETFLGTSNVLIGDRDSSDFSKIKRVVKRESSTTILDLESD
ncbi:MAG: hypothetical protein IJ685_03955 [Selenomonadaceae bacterium]|nr:hypothetical protein [Selenomonadaceae bacterium]